MGVFILIYLILLILSIKSRNKDGIAFVLLIFMFLINLFRAATVGSDTINYYNNQFYGEFNLLEFNSNYELEWIFQLTSAFIRDQGFDPRWCLYTLSIITYLFLFLSYKRYKKQIGCNLTLFLLFLFILNFYSLTFNIARQCASVAILLYAYSYLYSKNIKFFFIYVILAAGFHISSLLFIFLYFIRGFNINNIQNKSLIIASYAILIVIFLAKIYIWEIVFTLFPHLSLYENLLEDTEIGSFSAFSILLESFRLGLGLYVFTRLKKLGLSKYNTFLYLALISVIIMDSFFGNFTRIFHGIEIIRVVCYASLFSQKNLTKTDKIIFWIIALFYGIFVLMSLNNGAYEIVPYELDM